jgi:hypothetical protein
VGVIVSLLGVFLTVAEPSRAAVTISFDKSTLHNESSTQPTSLQFGPDGKLYVAQQNGLIKIYTVKRNGANNYAVTAIRTIRSIQRIPNHDDNGESTSMLSATLHTTYRPSTTRTVQGTPTSTTFSAATTARTRPGSWRAGRCRSTHPGSATPTTC